MQVGFLIPQNLCLGKSGGHSFQRQGPGGGLRTLSQIWFRSGLSSPAFLIPFLDHDCTQPEITVTMPDED